MRTKILLLLLAFACCDAIAFNADVRSAERDFEKVQKEISQLASQKMATETKLQKAEADLEEATAKMEETKDKPKSLPYKNAVKKAEKSQKKIEELRSSLLSIEADIESKSAELLNCQQILLSAQQAQEDDAAAKKQAKEDAKLAKQRKKDSIRQTKQHTDERNSDKGQECKEEYIVESTTISSSQDKTESYGSATSSNEDNKVTAWSLGLIVVLCIILGWFDFRRKHHCPKCGKWFTLDSEGDTRVWEHDLQGKVSKRGARKKYRCSNCGHKVEFIEWFSK